MIINIYLRYIVEALSIMTHHLLPSSHNFRMAPIQGLIGFGTLTAGLHPVFKYDVLLGLFQMAAAPCCHDFRMTRPEFS